MSSLTNPFPSLTALSPLTQSEALEFLNFVTSHPKLTYKETAYTLPSLNATNFANLSFTVYDVKIKCRGPDDLIYGTTNSRKVPQNEKIRDLITRGCIVIQVRDEKSQKDIYWNLFQGFCKFSGMTDEDDDDLAQLNEDQEERGSRNKNKNHQRKETKSSIELDGDTIEEIVEVDEEDSAEGMIEEIEDKTVLAEERNKANKDPYFLAPYTTATKMVHTRKENGKACHLAVFDLEHNGETMRFYVSGSKNVHIVFRNESDLVQHQESLLHVKAARTMLKMLSEMEADKAKIFEDVLSRFGLVANFEYMLSDDQHIVDYQLEDHLARLLGMTSRRIHNDTYKQKYGKCINPHDVIAWGKKLGVPVADVCEETDYSQENLNALIKKVRVEEQSEGSVIYFVDKDNRVVGLWKLKSQWYILFRAIREKLVRFSSTFNTDVHKRLKAIKSWIGLSTEEVNRWRITASYLYDYHLDLMRKNDLQGNRDSVRGNFAVNLRKFLEQFEMPTDIETAVEELPKEHKLSGISLKAPRSQQPQQPQQGGNGQGGAQGKKGKRKHKYKNKKNKRQYD